MVVIPPMMKIQLYCCLSRILIEISTFDYVRLKYYSLTNYFIRV